MKGLLNYLKTDLWRVRLRDTPPTKSFLIKVLRILVLSVRNFDDNRCLLHASALTFFTLLSIVPVVAMAFGIAKGFGFEKTLEAKILEVSEGQEEAFRRIIEFSNAMLEQTSGGLVAGIGVALLFWSIIKLLGNVERSFNEIWGIKKSRTLPRKFADYLSFMLVAPVLFMMAGSATVMVATQFEAFIGGIPFFTPFSTVAIQLLKLLPVVIVSGLFTFMYIFMPNGKVNFVAAMLGGVIAGGLYVLTQWVYITFQVGIGRYGAIYGSFAALPLFLIWLQVSWLIVLYGAELSFAYQNVDTYEFEPDCLNVSPALKKLLAVRIVQKCVQRFAAVDDPCTAAELSQELETPARLVNQILYELVEARVLSEVVRAEKTSEAYQPARVVEDLTVQGVLDLLDERGNASLPYRETEELQRLAGNLQALRQAAAASGANSQLLDV